MSFPNDMLKLAYASLNKSDLKEAITLFNELSSLSFQNEQPKIYTQALLGLAESYNDLGVYYLSIETLNRLLEYLDHKLPKEYLTYAKAHQQLADTYDLLFLQKEYLVHVNEFIKYYRLGAPDFKIYEAIYHAYLGRYYNLKFDIDEANKNTTRALNIYHKNSQHSCFIEIYKLYESHCFTLRNFSESEELKNKYIDTLKQKISYQFPENNLKKARALISLASIEMDNAYNILSNPNTVMSNKDRANMVQKAIKNYKKGINYYNDNNLYNHDYLPRYYDLQSWIFYGNKEYKKALDLINNGIESYANNAYLEEGFVANNYRIITSLRFKVLILDKLRIVNQNSDFDEDYLQTLLLYEKLWGTFLLELKVEVSDFVSNMYNQNPYQYLFQYYAQLYNHTKEQIYLNKAHYYEEKSKYGALLINLSLSNLQENERIEITRLKKNINILLNRYYLSVFLNAPNQEDLIMQIQKSIYQFNAQEKHFNRDKILKIKLLDSIQKQLDFDQALISYNYVGLGRDELYAKIITKNNSNLIQIRKSGDVGIKDYPYIIDSLYQSMAANDINNFKTLSLKLYTNLFEPLKDELPKNIKKIEVLPFPDIENLPFDLLLSSQTSSLDFRKLPYIAKDYTFSYSLSASIKQLTTSNKHKFDSDLAIFNPIFKNSTQSELNYANRISNQLSNELGGTLYLNHNATFNNFKRSLSDSKIVTLISHGSSSNSIHTMDKGIYLQDGFLSMDKVYEIDAKTDFLVLTACQSGLGFKDRGEGNINLVRAFRSIGVKSIMNANWEIDEKTSLDILKGFFSYLKTGMKKSEALKRAKMDYLNSCIPRYGNPIYWAGLNIVGDDSPIELKKNGPDFARIIWWSLVTIPALGMFYWLKKFR